MDEALTEADLTHGEVCRRLGGNPHSANDVVRQRLGGLLGLSAGHEDCAADVAPDDARRCGAAIVRLGGAATTRVLAEWMGWTLERTNAALAELDRRLDRCGLQLSADAAGRLTVRERARLRARPRRLAFELAERLDTAERLHALAHLVRGDHCPGGQDWQQPLLDLGAAVANGYPGAHPSEVIAAAFLGVRRRSLRPPLFVEVREDGLRPGPTFV